MSRIDEHNLQMAYRYYITDCLKMIAENTGKIAGGTSPKNRFYDLFRKPVVETRSQEEIIGNIKDKISKLRG